MPDPARIPFVLSCEHASNSIPRGYEALFAADLEALQTHRAYDIGARILATSLRRILRCPLILATASRLLVDVNRSAANRSLFSPQSRVLEETDREALMKRLYHPYRKKVEKSIARMIASRGRALHLSIHTFTPELDGKVRAADIGILYDPAVAEETRFGAALAEVFRDLMPRFRVRRNFPYRGRSDGMTAALRKIWPGRKYIGVEMEMNQALFLKGRRWPPGFAIKLGSALVEAATKAL